MGVSPEQIRRNFSRPGHPTAFSSANTVWRYYKKSVPLKKIHHILSDIDSYTLHRQYRKPSVRNPFYVYSKRAQVQVDLIDIMQLAESNDGMNYLVVFIDAFTRKMWIYPSKTKSAATIRNIMKLWLDEIGRPPKQIFCDRGGELKNQLVRRLLDERGIVMMHPSSDIKAGLVERANRSIQLIIYTYLGDSESSRYIDQLDRLVLTYNDRPHRSLKYMSPNAAERPKNALQVRAIARERYDKIAAARKKNTKYKIGQTVRIKKRRDRFTRGYHETANREYFKIDEVKTNQPITMYILKSYDTGELIQGGFYSNEIQLVGEDHAFKIEKVLKTRKYQGRTRHFVKWRDFGESHNSWIDAGQVTDSYNR